MGFYLCVAVVVRNLSLVKREFGCFEAEGLSSSGCESQG